MGMPERSSPVRVRDVLVSAVPELRDRLLEDAIRTDWSRLIGPELGRRSRSGRLHAGVLDVVVDNSPCLQEMTLRSSELLASVQRRFRAVASLRLTFGALPPVSEPAARRARSEPPSSLSHEELRAVEAMATSLSDPILAGCIRRLLTKDLLAHRLRDSRRRREDSRLAEREES
jgi:Dna[CI] antecedent DciA-like protein